jgi:imidazolonepropionase
VPLLRNIGLLVQCRSHGSQADIHPVPDAALVWQDDRITWVGPESTLPEEYAEWPAEDAGGRLVIPGLVDCHTHLAFGGWRGDEFADRIRGKSYQEIAAAGGGILSTVRQTRQLDEEALLLRCRDFLSGMAALGVTTVECKTGYGLEEATELRLLRVYDALARGGPQRIVPTLLAAHTWPPEYQQDHSGYVGLVIEQIIPRARSLARFCDVFVEEGAFTIDEARRILQAGLAAGLRPKLHADQLSAGGGAELAAELGAASADHLEHIRPAGIAAMRRAGVVAVSLPIASLYLRQPPLPARELIEAGVPVAVATDFNPGSAPSYHLPLALTLACTLQRMTPAEALKGATIIAARAAGVEGECGSIEPGNSADFAVIDAPDVNHWLYHFRANACVRTVVRGRTVWAGNLAIE